MVDRVRVLLSTTDFPPMTGGIQLLLDRLAQSSRHDFAIVSPAVRVRRYLPVAGSKAIWRTPRVRSHRAEVAMLSALTLQRALQTRPDVLLCGHIVLGPATLLAGRSIGSPVVQYMYGKELNDRPAVTATVLARAQASIAISAHTRALAHSIQPTPGRLETIVPGCDPPTAPVPPLGERGGAPTILTVARLADSYKGFDVMLRALPLVRARIPDVRWVVVGDGPLMGTLKGTASAWNLEAACIFAGRLSNRERDQWLDRAHIFAMPSRVEASRGGGGEGFGIVYLEAGAHRLPCVGGREGGAADAVIDGVTGMLVDATDHVAVAEALCALLGNQNLASQMGEAGARRAAELSWQRMTELVDDLLERVVRLPRGREDQLRKVLPSGVKC